jgi:hypothetical protein
MSFCDIDYNVNCILSLTIPKWRRGSHGTKSTMDAKLKCLEKEWRWALPSHMTIPASHLPPVYIWDMSPQETSIRLSAMTRDSLVLQTCGNGPLVP